MFTNRIFYVKFVIMKGSEIMPEINRRMYELRKTMNLSQEEFGKKIGISKSGISNIENASRNVTVKHVKLVCNENWDGKYVNEEWLRTGEGSMFIEMDREDEIMAWAGSMMRQLPDDADFIERLAKVLKRLDADSMKVLLDVAERMAKDD